MRLLPLSLAFLFSLAAQVQSPASQPNDPAARKFLRAADERSASWQGFPGFTAEIRVYRDGLTHSGLLTVTPDGRHRVELVDGESRKWASAVISSISATTNRKDFEERYKDIGFSFGVDDNHPLGQLVNTHGDPYQSRFRVLDGEIRVIERVTPTERIFLKILSLDRDEKGQKLGRTFVVYYFDRKSGALLRSQAIEDQRSIIGGYVLPSVWNEINIQNGQPATTSLTLFNHAMLPANGSKP